jgi:putative ABC transport system permease protein
MTMRMLRAWLLRLRGQFRKERMDLELSEELASHLALNIEDNLRAGMTAEEARREALMKLGGLEQTKEECRDHRGLPMLETLLQDLRFGLRMLGKSPGFTAVAVLTLAIGIGANTAIFSIIYGVLIRPLAVPEARQVVQLVLKDRGEVTQDNFTYSEFRYVQEHSDWSEVVAAFTHVGFNLSSANGAERVSALHVSTDYFRVLGAGPSLGREFSHEEDLDPSSRVAILGHNLWQHRFGGDAAVLGTTIHLNGEPYLVVGVMPSASTDVQLDLVPPAFGDLQHVDLWTTLAPVGKSVGSGENLAVVARLKPGVSFVRAASQLGAMSESFRQEYLSRETKFLTLGLSSIQDVMAANVNVYLRILLAAVAFVLLIACANVSNLLLTQGTARAREIAIRAVMGANRRRLIRQFLSESLVLSGLGCVFGFFVAKLALAALLRFAPIQLPRVTEIRVDGWAFLFALVITILAGALSGMVPAFQTAKTDLNLKLKDSAGRSSSDRRGGLFRSALVVAEIALSIILLIGASLLGETFLNLLRVNPGFEPSGMLSAEIWLTGSRYRSTTELAAFYDNLTTRLKQIPGVQGAAVVSLGQPLERGGNEPVKVTGADWGSMDCRVVTADYFQTLRVEIKRGRDFSKFDSESAQPVVIVNEAFVRQVLKDADPFAASVQVGQKDGPWRIVGVAADVKSDVNLAEDPTVFLPLPQTEFGLIQAFDVWFPTHIMVRTAGDPQLFSNAVNAAILETDASIPLGHILTMDQVLARSLAIQRFMMVVVAVFAVLALALAAIGIYGVVSFSVAQRTQEFGIRMALGADPRSVLGLVIRDAAWLAGIGMATGIVGAIALHQAMASVLFGVQPTDPRTIAIAAIGLLSVAFLACYIPARRATRVDPMIALRHE